MFISEKQHRFTRLQPNAWWNNDQKWLNDNDGPSLAQYSYFILVLRSSDGSVVLQHPCTKMTPSARLLTGSMWFAVSAGHLGRAHLRLCVWKKFVFVWRRRGWRRGGRRAPVSQTYTRSGRQQPAGDAHFLEPPPTVGMEGCAQLNCSLGEKWLFSFPLQSYMKRLITSARKLLF